MSFLRIRSRWSVSGTNHSLESLAFEHGYRLDAIADRLGCSTRHLHQLFHRDIGLPPKQWLKAERMVVARRMLEGGLLPARIAKLLGFATRGNFGREFVAIHGIPPGTYLQQARARQLGEEIAGPIHW